MKEKKFFDSYVEYRSPVHGANGNGADGNNGDAPPPETRALPPRDAGALAHYDGEAPARLEIEPAEASERASKPDALRAFLDLAWRRRFTILPVFLGVLLLALILSLRAQRVYSATATLLVNTTPLSGEKRPDDQNADKVASDVPTVDEARRLETQLEIVKTEGVAKAAIANLTPDQKAAVDRYASIDVGSIRNTDLVTVTVASHQASASAALANAICQSYITQSQKNNRAQIEAAAQSAQRQLQTVKDDLSDARAALKDYQSQSGITDGADQSKNVGATLDALVTQLREAQTQRASVAATLRVQQDVLAKTPREVVTYTTVTRPAVVALREQLTKLRLDRIAARAEYAPTSSVVTGLDGQIADVEARLAREPATETSPAQSAPNPAYLTAAQAVAQGRSDLSAVQARIPVIQAALARATNAQTQLPAKISRLNFLNSNLAALQNTYDNLNSKVQTLQLSAASQLANGSVTSPATVPGAPVGPSRAKTLLGAALLGALLAYLAALLVDRLDEKIHDPREAERMTSLPILISLPRISNPMEQCLLTGNAPFLRESFEMLAAQIALAGRRARRRSILMTSALPGEGKSVSCVNLAVAAAWAGEEVVLVDCDLRRPTAHLFFGLSNDVGFSDVVLGDATLRAAVQATKIPGLSVLTAGSAHQSPLELMRSRATQAILDELVELTDLTIVDSPPVLLIADAALLCTMTDATILVVACGEAAQNEVARAAETLRKTGASLMGLVLTKVGASPGEKREYGAYSSRHSLEGLRGPREVETPDFQISRPTQRRRENKAK